MSRERSTLRVRDRAHQPTVVFLRLNGHGMVVDAAAAHAFLVGLLDRGECDYDRLLPWIRGALGRT